MSIFNTKKERAKWKQKIEESYLKGKCDAKDEYLSKEINIDIDEVALKKMTEKEMIIEIYKTLNMQNKRIDNLSKKISNITDYDVIFKEINKLLKEVISQEEIMENNLKLAQTQVHNFNNNVLNIKDSIQSIKDTLDNTNSTKDRIEEIGNDLHKIIPKLQNYTTQINDIIDNMNNTILKSKEGPIEILYKIDEKLGKNYDEDYEYDNIYKMISEIKDETYDILNEIRDLTS